MSKSDSKYLIVRQVKSGIGQVKSQKATLIGLGLGKINRTARVLDNASTRGMIKKVSHLVEMKDE